ncbi:hypothetical protein [Subtercola sp. RTI3]|uniref:hypothetical protein n=1 Tax=Subtercola sp. RTI3 TaxID=3048639 RepID=UPI002B2396D1|nr:hypothetical protein [Subtercola sp. RTI3]MEA9986612.1 hypothetical protein [Subtercola sp. RTI3]
MVYSTLPATGASPASHQRRHPLSRRARVGALGAGALSLGLVALGGDFIAAVLGQLAFFYGATFLFDGMQTFDLSDPSVGIPADAATVFGISPVVIVAAGAFISALGVVSGILLLRRAGTHRPIAVTLASLAISAVPLTIGAALSGVLAMLAFGVLGSSDAGGDSYVVVVGVAAGIHVASALPLGALVWWWMAATFARVGAAFTELSHFAHPDGLVAGPPAVLPAVLPGVLPAVLPPPTSAGVSQPRA